jgi:hypothetical protein
MATGPQVVIWLEGAVVRNESERRSPLDFPLQPAGRLVIHVDPADAEVRVQGDPLERHGPTRDVSLLVGSYTVEVIRPGFHGVREEIAIRQAETREMVVRLRPVSVTD